VNIVSIAMQYLAPMIVERIASSLGLNKSLVDKAVAVIVPALLAAVVGKAAQPGGGQAISDVLAKQDAGSLGKLGDILGGPQAKQFSEQGGNVLGSLLGGNAIGALTGAVGKFAGIGDAPTKGLVGMLGPVVLGTLAAQQKSAGLDAGGLAKMLMGQKDNIAAAIPGDFAKMLGGTGLLDAIGPAKAAAAPAPAAPKPDAPVSAAPVSTAPKGGSFNVWPWLIAILAAAAAWWFLFAGPRVTKPAALPTPPSIMVGNVDLGSQLGSVLGGLQGSLGGIKDVGSAQAALAGLQRSQADLDRLGGLVGQLSGDHKKSLATYIAAVLPMLMPVINNLLASSSLGPIVKPVLEAIVGRLNTMAKA